MTTRFARQWCRTVAIALALLLAAISNARADEAGSFEPSGAARQLSGAPGIYEWRYRAKVGPGAYDQV